VIRYISCILSVEQRSGLHIDRAYAGKFAASMEMAGFSLSLMLLNDERLQCLGNGVTSRWFHVGFKKTFIKDWLTNQ